MAMARLSWSMEMSEIDVGMGGWGDVVLVNARIFPLE
jgi:hypothetical protein